ncbi:hypothetical protein E2C01_055698 [Portunus trituberculatus]|uniref:Uncharacterized protein n=1 Tax=Portunus trituberculatus TaxID=210409 RepID=A0A5B7GYE9_PORTR|nr:hypothetical protein [Portunus trituberculatus]
MKKSRYCSISTVPCHSLRQREVLSSALPPLASPMVSLPVPHHAPESNSNTPRIFTSTWPPPLPPPPPPPLVSPT